MERPATLNPASMPFFPGAFRGDSESSGRSMGYQNQGLHELDRASTSTLSISPSDYRSVKSSPSPPSDYKSHPKTGSEASIWTNENPFGGRPPNDANRLPRGFEHPTSREGFRSTSIEASSDSDKAEVSSIRSAGTSGQMPTSFFTPSQRSPEGKATPPVSINPGYYNGPKSTSPVSSLDSGSQFTNPPDRQTPSFEAQLRSSPAILDILSRIAQCERFTGEIQRDLNEVHRKVNLLLERSLDAQHAQPEFKDPFASNKPNGASFASPPLGGPRPSISGIAPNQTVPGDDISTISARLNTLTSSVGQLLAIQTQQIQATNEMRSNSIVGPLGMGMQPGDQTPIGPLSPPAPPMMGHGLPQRPEQRPQGRHPGPPMRTWSSGTLDMPIRGSEPNINRPGMMSRDKRQSVTTLLRRDSSSILDLNGDSMGGTSRDGGPMITKWEQLSLSPDLLRSLNKFGVGPPNKIQQRALPFLLRGSDIIAQAPPTQERIAAYVIPAIQIAVSHTSNRHPNRGPIVVMISTTVDQATQAQRMIRDLGGPIGVKSALGVGATSSNTELTQELRLLQQSMPHIICGTPQKLHGLFTSPGGLIGSEVRFLVLDEVDQLIARNLHDFVLNIVKLLPAPRSRPPAGTPVPGSSSNLPQIPQEPGNGIVSPLLNQGRKFSVAPGTSPIPPDASVNANGVERQTALFSNTVPQDVLNLATTIQLREPVRVLVRRDGNVTSTETNQGSRGLRQFYLYLAFTAGGRAEPGSAAPGGGHGIIGSGRGATSAETTQAREWKLDALADLFDDVDVSQAIVHVGGMTSLESVAYKLATRGLEVISLHSDMNTAAKSAALNKFRSGNAMGGRQPASKVLIVYDVQIKPPEVSHVPLIINYDLPKAVEEYAHRVAPAIAHNYSRAGVVVNFVTATGGDVEMLRSIECFYKIKCPEVPMSLRDIV